jgi:DNA-binding helix-hairpin-helix protein with protein kinase domain
MIDLNTIPCIVNHKHLWSSHKVCQWCHKEMDNVELLALRLKVKELEITIIKTGSINFEKF